MKNVVSYSLWGSNPFYTDGALHNVRLVKKYYPDWVCRIYVDQETTPFEVVNRLQEEGAEIIYRFGNKGTLGSMWRFEVMFDDTVDRYIIRDTDSRIYLREKLAVDEWIESGKSYHVMRDNEHHNIGMLAGMWGGRVVASTQFKNEFNKWIKNPQMQTHKGCDQDFLARVMWKHVMQDMVCHDRTKNSRACIGGELDFPIELIENYFVGAPVHNTESHEDVYENYKSNS